MLFISQMLIDFAFLLVNKQLADKERIAAALENIYLLDVLNDCLMLPEPQTLPKFVENELQKLDIVHHPKVVYIQLSRQHIESYRRWAQILDDISKNSS